MNKTLMALIVAFPALCFATTGGAETVQALSWDRNRQRVWFVAVTSGGYGRAVGYFNAKTGKKVIVCSARPYDDSSATAEALETLLAQIAAKYKPLQAISMKRLGVSVAIQAQKPTVKGHQIRDPGLYEESLTGISLPWRLQIKSKGRRLAAPSVHACDFSHKGLVSGYGHRGEAFAVLVVSTTNVCVEGGYRTDELVFVRRVPVKTTHFLASLANDGAPEKIGKLPPGSVGFEFDKAQLASSLNTIGYRAYRAGRAQAARSYFHRAVDFQIGQPFDKGARRLAYNLPLFNLAATMAKLGQKEDALDCLEALLSRTETRQRYLTKIRREKDFDSLNKEKRFQTMVR